MAPDGPQSVQRLFHTRACGFECMLLRQHLLDELFFELVNSPQHHLVDLRVGPEIVENLEAAEQSHLVGDDDVLNQRGRVLREHTQGLIGNVGMTRNRRPDRLAVANANQQDRGRAAQEGST